MVMCSITILALLIRLRHAMLCPRVPQLEPVRAYNLINPTLHNIACCGRCEGPSRLSNKPILLLMFMYCSFCQSSSCVALSDILVKQPSSDASSNKLFYLQFNPMSFVGALMESGATKN